MAKFEYTEIARKELINIIGYTVDTWGQSQALKYVDGLEVLAQRLAETPELGKHRADIFLKRKILIFPYAVIPNGISIIRILHESMNVKKQFKKG